MLGLYVHNDLLVAFRESYKEILIEPMIGQVLQIYSNFVIGSTGIEVYSSVLYSSVVASIYIPGDLLVSHATSLGIHMSTLIIMKAALDSRGSGLLPDKQQYGFSYSCDGPSRGGTCDISSWDTFYLTFFWMLNSMSWLMFHIHWKYLLVSSTSINLFDESSTYLNGWFRDYLWLNSGTLIRGYDIKGSNDLAVWS